MITKTCAYCDHHLWMDELSCHACCKDLDNPVGKECTDSCENSWKKSRRGTLGQPLEVIKNENI